MKAVEIKRAAGRNRFAGVVEDGRVEEFLRVPPILGSPDNRVPIAEAIVFESTQVTAADVGHQKERHLPPVVSHGCRNPGPEKDDPVAMKDRKILLGRGIDPTEREHSVSVGAVVVIGGAQKRAAPRVSLAVAKIECSKCPTVNEARVRAGTRERLEQRHAHRILIMRESRVEPLQSDATTETYEAHWL